MMLTLFLLLAAGVVSQVVAGYLRVPRMLVLLAAGALLGPSVLAAIEVPLDSVGAQLLLTLGVSVILFHGGLQLSVRVLDRVAVGLGMLVVPGVLVTAVITGLVAAAVFDLPFSSGLLMGAALSPTDPAILIPLFERIRVRPKISQTVIAESALNDVTGAVVALAIAGVVLTGGVSFTETLEEFLVDLGISTALGIAFGIVLCIAVSTRRFGLSRDSAAIVAMAVVAGAYFSIDFAGGSGYLGAFLAGLILANNDRLRLTMHRHHEQEMRSFIAVVTDVMVMLVFLTVGANLPWSEMASHFGPALAVVATLILLARPLTVLACLLPDRRGRWSREEYVFLAWTRETGVMPAALVGIIVGLGVPHADLVVTTVALAILTTLAVQSTTKSWLARRLHLVDAPTVPPTVSSAHERPATAGFALSTAGPGSGDSPRPGRSRQFGSST